jgi:tetratricopeptide (TPR) repeat protein
MKQPDPLTTAQDLCMHGIALSSEGKREESLIVYTQVLEQYGSRRSVPFLRVLATAMFNMGTTLGILERNEESVKAYDKLIAKLDKQDKPELMLYIVKAMMNKAYRLNTLLKNDEAIETYQAVVKRFGGTKDSAMLPFVDSVKAFLAQRKEVLDSRAANAQA